MIYVLGAGAFFLGNAIIGHGAPLWLLAICYLTIGLIARAIEKHLEGEKGLRVRDLTLDRLVNPKAPGGGGRGVQAVLFPPGTSAEDAEALRQLLNFLGAGVAAQRSPSPPRPRPIRDAPQAAGDA